MYMYIHKAQRTKPSASRQPWQVTCPFLWYALDKSTLINNMMTKQLPQPRLTRAWPYVVSCGSTCALISQLSNAMLLITHIISAINTISDKSIGLNPYRIHSDFEMSYIDPDYGDLNPSHELSRLAASLLRNGMVYPLNLLSFKVVSCFKRLWALSML